MHDFVDTGMFAGVSYIEVNSSSEDARYEGHAHRQLGSAQFETSTRLVSQ